MKITEEELIIKGWHSEVICVDITVYYKNSNGFHYTVSKQKGNWYDWSLHIDSPDFDTVGRIEVDTFEQIDTIMSLYKIDCNERRE